MVYLVLISMSLSVVTLVWAVALLVRMRDWRVLWLVGLVTFLIGQQTMSLLSLLREGGEAIWIDGQWFAAGTVLLCLGAVATLSRMIGETRTMTASLLESEREALREYDELRAIYDNAPVGMSIVDTDLKFRALNERQAKINGLPVERHLGRTVREVLPWLADQIEPIYRQVIATGQASVDALIHGPAADGGPERDWSATHYPVRDRSGRIIAVGAAIFDITERLRVERELRQSEQTQRALLSTIPDAIFRMDDRGVYLSYSAPPETRLILPPEKFLGKKVTEVLDANLAGKCMNAIGAALATGQMQWYEYEYVGADGQKRFWEVRVVVTGPREVMLLVRNTTERKFAELELRAKREELERAQAVAHVGSWVADLTGSNRLEWSTETCRIFGIDPAQFDHQLATFFRHVHPDDRELVRAAERAAWSGGPGYSIDHRIVRSDGQVRWVHEQADLVYDQTGRVVQMLGVVQDITDRKLAEEFRTESERRYRLLFEVNPQPMWVIDENTLEFLAVNRAAVDHYGYSESEFMKMTLRDIRPAEDVPALERAMREEAPQLRAERVWRHRLKSGAIIEVMVSSNAIQFQGRTARLAAVTDVTARRRAEQEVRVAEEKYRSLFEQAPDGLMIVDPGPAGPIEANPALQQMLGYGREELLGLTVADIEARGAADIGRHLAGAPDREVDEFESRMRTKSGREIDVALRIRVFDIGGKKRLQISVRDITERKRAEERLRTAEQRNALMIQQTQLGVIVWDTERRAIEWNPTAEKIFGYRAEEAIGRPFDELIVPERARSRVDRVWQGLISGTGGTNSSNENVTKDGRRITCEWYNTPLVDANGNVIGVASLVQDVTELKRLEEELRQSQKMEAIGQLASGVAHDFSNLLTAIFGFTSLARRTLSPQHPAVRSLDRVDEAAQQAAGVTKALLTFSRGEASEKRPIRVGQVVEDAARLLRRTMPTNIEIRTKVDPAPLWVQADVTQLQQVVMNLAINARDAMPQGGQMTITVGTHEGPGRPEAFVAVADSGVGMTPEIQNRIFEPFFTTKPAGQGTGLGLSIIHGIVQDHDGRITVQSQVGRGSTFTVFLPATDPAEAAASESAEARPVPGKGEQILLASGRAYIREIMAASLASMGYQVVQAGDMPALRQAIAGSSGRARVLVLELETMGPRAESLWREMPRDPDLRTILLGSGINSQSEDGEGGGIYAAILPQPFQMTALGEAVREALK